MPKGLCASLTFKYFLGRLKLLNQNFENSAFCSDICVTVKATVSNQKIPLYVTYLYPTILVVYIVLGTFSVELQSEKRMKKDYKLYNQLYDHIAY